MRTVSRLDFVCVTDEPFEVDGRLVAQGGLPPVDAVDAGLQRPPVQDCKPLPGHRKHLHSNKPRLQEEPGDNGLTLELTT